MAGRNVVGVSPSSPRLHTVMRRQHDPGAILADEGGDLPPVREIILEAGIPQAKDLEGIQLQDSGRRRRLPSPDRAGPRAHIPLRKADDPPPLSTRPPLEEE